MSQTVVHDVQDGLPATDLLQSVLDYYAKVPQERIYLQTDKPYYAAGDTVWLRAHVVDAATLAPIARSRFVYVELHDQQADTLMQRLLVKCDSNGVFASALFLPRAMRGGTYTLAAYTQWMRNFPAERFCYKPLTIVTTDNNGPVRRLVESPQATMAYDSLLLVGQRKGLLLIQLNGRHDGPLSCLVYGSGNLLELGYTPGKVLRIDCGRLRSGMATVAMVNPQTGDVVAQQAVCIEGGNVAVATIGGTAATAKAPVTLAIDVRNQDGQPLQGHYALSVTDYDVVRPDSLLPDIRQTLQQRPAAGYALADMLARRYPDITYPFQTEQLITGRVKGTLKASIKHPHLLLVNYQTGLHRNFALGDSTRFAVAVDNPEGTVFSLEGTRNSGKTSFVELQVDTLTFPRLRLPHYISAVATNLTAFATQAKTQQMYSYDAQIDLPEVVKTGKKPQPLRSNWSGIEAPRGFPVGDPQLERASSLAQLLGPLGLKVVHNGRNSFITTSASSAGVKIYLDNFVVQDDDEIDNLLAMPVTDIRSIEYFTPNNPMNTIFGVTATSRGLVPGVLFIFLKDGSEVARTAAKDKLSVAIVRQLGYRRPVEFHSPQYPLADKSTYSRPDHRTTLYWNPKVQTGERVTFYASDVSKRYLVTLEGVSNDGTVVCQQTIIEP